MKFIGKALHHVTATRKKLAKIRKKQPSNCFILENLPVELIYAISDELTPVSRAILSQTCRALYTILAKDAGTAHLHRGQYLEYLALTARDLPEEWMCEVCMALHPISEKDTPAEPWNMTCPLWNVVRLSHLKSNLRESIYNARHLRPNYHHVQLALKYTRTQFQHHRTYFRKLMAPYHDTCFQTHVYPKVRPNSLPAQYSAFPKIVEDADGRYRFLLLSIWRYHGSTGKDAVSLKTIGNLEICPHMQFHPNYRHSHYCPSDILGRVLYKVVESQVPYGEVRGGCPRCPTDFSVQAHARYTEVRAWQDLGPEVSPLSPEWRAITKVPCEQCEPLHAGFRGNLVVYHDLGSVRTLYNAGPDKGRVRLPKPTATGRPEECAMDRKGIHETRSHMVATILRLMNILALA